MSHCLKTFLNLFKLLKQTNPGDLGVEGIQRKLFTDNTFSLKRRHELQRFLDEVLADPKAMASPYTVEFLGLKRRPDRTVPKMAVKAWKDVNALENYDALAIDLANTKRDCAALASKNRALVADVQVNAERVRSSETRGAFMSEIERINSEKVDAANEWGRSRADELRAALAKRQAHVCLLTQASNALETENEKLRIELQSAKARFLVYERALEAAAAAAATSGSKSDGGNNSETEERVARLQHENMSLKAQVLRLESLVASVQSDRDSRAREFEEAALRQSAREQELRSQYDRAAKECDVLRQELRAKGEYIDTLTREGETCRAQLDAAVAENARLGERYAALKGDLAQRDLSIWLLRYQVKQLLREVAVMTVERDRYGIEPPRTSRTLLMYSGQYGEGLDVLESLERQNAAFREQMLHDSGRIKALSADAEAMKGEAAAAAAKLRAERERCERYELLLEQNNVPVEDISSDKISDVMKLRASVDALRKELAAVKQKYFFDLALSIKMQSRSQRKIAELYNEVVRDAVPVDEWTKWINRKLSEAHATPPSSPKKLRTMATPPPSPSVTSSEAISIPVSPSLRGTSPPAFTNTHIQRIPTLSSANVALSTMLPPDLYYSTKKAIGKK